MNETTLTTFDNPYSPFDNFVQWFLFDVEQGYNTCAKLGRIAKLRSDMSQIEENAEVERACDEIIMNDPFNIYKKVSRINMTA